MARTTGERRTWRSVTSVCITSIIIIGLLLLIEDVVNLDVITQTEALTRLKMQPTSQLITVSHPRFH